MKIDPLFMLVLSVLISALNYLFWARVKRIEKDIADSEEETKKIKNNYLLRFDDLKKSLSEAEKNIIDRIHHLEKSFIKNYISKEECEFFKEMNNKY